MKQEEKMVHCLISIENPLECRIIQRINRFVVEITINGSDYRACINYTGRFEEFLIPDKKGFCVRNERPGTLVFTSSMPTEDGPSH